MIFSYLKSIFQIMELIYDAEINVKSSSIRLIFKMIDIFSPDVRMNRLSFLFIELLGSINEEVLKVISSMIGFIISKVIQHFQIKCFLKKLIFL